MSGRWKLGDVLVWLQTGAEQDARSDADVLLSFRSRAGEFIGWVRAFERSDGRGFEPGDLNLGFIGNLHRQPWLQALLDEGVIVDVRLESEDTEEAWYLERVSLDFRVGPVVDVSTTRTFSINERINVGVAPRPFDADGDLQTGASMFEESGFEQELELESGPGEPATAA